MVIKFLAGAFQMEMDGHTSDPKLDAEVDSFLVEVRGRTNLPIFRFYEMQILAAPQQEILMSSLVEMISPKLHPGIRASVYTMFKPPESKKHFEALLEIFDWETDSYARDRLIQMLVAAAGRKKDMLASALLKRPRLLSADGLRFIAMHMEKDSELNDLVSQLICKNEFRLASLHEFTVAFAAGYDTFIQKLQGSERRFSAQECKSVMQFQVPGMEFYRRRAEFIPYYAIVRPGAEMAGSIDAVNSFGIEHGIPVELGWPELQQKIASNGYAIVGLRREQAERKVSAMIANAVAAPDISDDNFKRPKHHKGRPKRPFAGDDGKPLLLRLATAPEPQEWNRLPDVKLEVD